MNVGLVYAVLAALLFGGYLYALKRYFSAYPSSVFLLVTYLLALPVYLPAVVLSDDPFLPAGNRLSILGAVLGVTALTAVALLAFFKAIKLGDVSYVSPISKIVPVFVLPLEVGLLGQHLSAFQVAGVVVATVAIYVANWEGTSLTAPLRRALTTPAARLALLSAAVFGLVDVGKRVLMQELAVAPTTYLPVFFVGISLVMAPLATRHELPDRLRADLPKFVVAAVVVAYANHVTLLAFQTLPASVVSPVVNGQAVVAVVLGGLLLGEQHFRARLVAAGLAIVGVTMITVG